MPERFYTVDVPIPALLEDLFKGLALCNNGSIVVAYKRPVIFDNVNIGAESTMFQSLGLGVQPGMRVALDMRVLERG